MSGESPGRAVQGRIYRAGALGRRPRVPVLPRRLERAAQRSMSRQAWAYVAGSPGSSAPRGPTSRRSPGTGSSRGCSAESAARDTSVDLLGTRLPAPCCSRRSGCSSSPTAERRRRRGPRGRAAGPADGASRRRRRVHGRNRIGDRRQPRWFQLYWSRDRELVGELRARAEAAGYGAIVVTLDTHLLGWRTVRPRSRPPAVRPRPGHRAVHERSRVHPARARARRPGPAAPGQPERRRGRARRRPDPALAWPGLPRPHGDNLRSPLPRAAVETFLDVFSAPR